MRTLIVSWSVSVFPVMHDQVRLIALGVFLFAWVMICMCAEDDSCER